MTSSFGVQTVFTTASKLYFAVNSFQKRVLVIPNVTKTFFIQDVCVTPKADVNHVCIEFSNRDEDLTKPLHGDVFITFKTCASLQKRYKLKTSNTFAFSFQNVFEMPCRRQFC